MEGSPKTGDARVTVSYHGLTVRPFIVQTQTQGPWDLGGLGVAVLLFRAFTTRPALFPTHPKWDVTTSRYAR
jgi:hypothetical protein